MTIYNLKPLFQNLLRPIVNFLQKYGITANQITLSAMFLSIAVGLLLSLFPSTRFYWLLPIFLFIRMALNAIDGMLAREHHQKSHLGAIYNELGDVISDIALYLPFCFLPNINSVSLLVILFLSVLTEFIGVLAQTVGASRRYDGPMGKSDRAFVFGTYGLIIAFFPSALSWSHYLFPLVIILLLITCYQRVVNALREIKPAE
ncbi:CDP-alcohol phosphatidyltransferase family protein [Xenorhabdus sp. DI]|uniref:CDP-alcohol phosphatidyltransferase family protein n=1 Tax=Xenorhabdus doucetiae TaxID=351671 RepID=UPI00199553BC|nr:MULTISPECIES: CDP-alcohol phosphatidyltransferase family protein [unclassified Xenorhabdus]MBD2785909.1 CDP-alcohol phosphatidyltransferase family protein [Xenorhabdus sp. 3]MBD2789566.1 CDP-alcohol phosphatidyltransferase family protein [Xenorhabdus sp. DI]